MQLWRGRRPATDHRSVNGAAEQRSEHTPMKRAQSPEFKAAVQLASLRAEAVWACLNVLCPNLEGEAKKELARKMLTLADGKDRSKPRCPAKQIGPAQIEEIIWANIQCIYPRCPMLLFSKQIAEEINEFFREERNCG
jgi:hypothetical protein